MKTKNHVNSYNRKLLKNSDGAVLIELAIALPVLLLIILGGIELGLYFMKQHIVSRAVNSVIIPLQLNPSDPRREIERQIRNSGMGVIDFSLGNTKGNYVCARSYSDFATAQKNLCTVENSFDNGWHPEPGFWVINPMRPYYVVVLAHSRYRSLVGLKGMLPDIREYHIFQVNPFSVTQPAAQIPVPALVPPAPENTEDGSALLGGTDYTPPVDNNQKTIEDSINQLNDIINKMGVLKQR